MSTATLIRRIRAHKGSTVIFVAIGLVMFLGFAALAVDVGYLYVVRGELQNAADSGALAGAQVLYNNMGTEVNELANAEALEYVVQNRSEQAPATVDDSIAYDGIERGHWSFATRTFTRNDSTAPVDLWDVSTEELDANPNFINAVRVITRRKREGGQLPSHFFATIFGGPRTEVKATAVGYIGFAGTLEPAEVDQPIAICRRAIMVGDDYSCTVGRMINSGGQIDTSETGGWTNFSQPSAPGGCSKPGGSDVPGLINTGNTWTLNLGDGLGTTNGEVQVAFNKLVDEWIKSSDTDADGIPDRPWEMSLPVIDCDDSPVGEGLCTTPLVGAVTLNVVWITQTDKTQMKEVPRRMGDWVCTSGTPVGCWTEFVQTFNLQNLPTGLPQTPEAILNLYQNKTIYFLPDCEPQELRGHTGGQNFGVLAKIPVLVK